MRWYQYTVEEFERTSNPGNAQTIVMTRKDNQQYAGDPTYILEPAGRVALGLALSKTDRHYMHQRRSLPRGHQDAIPEEEDTGATSPQGRTPRRDLSMVLEGICALQKPDVAADTKNSDK